MIIHNTKLMNKALLTLTFLAFCTTISAQQQRRPRFLYR